MAATLTTLDGLMKNVYLPGLPNWINNKRPLMGRINKVVDKKDFKGRKFIFGAQDGNSQGTGWIAELETLPAGLNASVVNMELTAKYHYAVARLSAQVLDAADGDRGSFKRAVRLEMDSVRNQLEKDIAIASIYGDGSGSLGKVSTYATTVLTMLDQPTVGMNGTRNLDKGMIVQSYSAKSAGTQGANHITISAIASGTVATVPTSAGFNANDFLFRSVTASVDPRNKAAMGLGGIVDDGTRVGTFQTLSRTTNPSLKANILGNSGTLRAWTPELMDQGAMESSLNGGGEAPTAIYSPLEIQRRAASYIRADRMYDMSVKTLDGGYKAVEWTSPSSSGAVPWFWDRYCLPNEVHFIREDDLFMAIQTDTEMVENDGRMWRYTDRSDVLEAWLRTWRNMGAYAANNCTAIQDVSHTL